MTWLKTKKHKETTLVPMTPSTHCEPRLNDLDPSDPTVQALAPSDAEDRLPPIPVTRGGLR